MFKKSCPKIQYLLPTLSAKSIAPVISCRACDAVARKGKTGSGQSDVHCLGLNWKLLLTVWGWEY